MKTRPGRTKQAQASPSCCRPEHGAPAQLLRHISPSLRGTAHVALNFCILECSDHCVMSIQKLMQHVEIFNLALQLRDTSEMSTVMSIENNTGDKGHPSEITNCGACWCECLRPVPPPGSDFLLPLDASHRCKKGGRGGVFGLASQKIHNGRVSTARSCAPLRSSGP